MEFKIDVTRIHKGYYIINADSEADARRQIEKAQHNVNYEYDYDLDYVEDQVITDIDRLD